jgi:hypothetical protein
MFGPLLESSRLPLIVPRYLLGSGCLGRIEVA